MAGCLSGQSLGGEVLGLSKTRREDVLRNIKDGKREVLRDIKDGKREVLRTVKDKEGRGPENS